MRNMRHVVNVMAPPLALDSRGDDEGQPRTVLKNVPCSIETLSGREAEIARSAMADATYKVEMYADPRNPVTADMYLTGGTLGKRTLPDGKQVERKLHIGFVNDLDQKGLQYELLCGEDLSGG